MGVCIGTHDCAEHQEGSTLTTQSLAAPRNVCLRGHTCCFLAWRLLSARRRSASLRTYSRSSSNFSRSACDSWRDSLIYGNGDGESDREQKGTWWGSPLSVETGPLMHHLRTFLNYSSSSAKYTAAVKTAVRFDAVSFRRVLSSSLMFDSVSYPSEQRSSTNKLDH